MSNPPDYALFLEDFLPTIDNVPGEVQHVLSELQAKDTLLHSHLDSIREKDQKLGLLLLKCAKNKLIDQDTVNELEEEISHEFTICSEISKEKVQLAERIRDVLGSHLARMTGEIEILESTSLSAEGGALLQESVIDLTRTRSNAELNPSAQLRSVPAIPRKAVALRPPLFVKRVKRKMYSTINQSSDHLLELPLASTNDSSVSVVSVASTATIKNDELFCICQQVSYGEMIACDNDDCKVEWFHLSCVGLNESPSGVNWYCKDCVELLG